MLELIEADELDVAFSLRRRRAPGRDRGRSSSARRRWSSRSRPARRPRATVGQRRRPRRPPLATPALGLGDQAGDRRRSSPRRRGLRLSLESGDPYLIRCLVSDGFGAAVLPASITRREGPPVETPAAAPPGPAARSTCSGAATATARRPPSAFIEFVRGEAARARGREPDSPVARVAGRDPVADQGRLGDLDRDRGGGLAVEVELLRGRARRTPPRSSPGRWRR